MSLLWNVLFVILRALLPALFERKPDTMEDAAPQTELRNRLRGRIRSTWKTATVVVILLSISCASGGCWLQRTRTVYVKAGAPVRIRETIHDAKVWVKGADGNAVAGTVDIPEGWYALDDPGEDGVMEP